MDAVASVVARGSGFLVLKTNYTLWGVAFELVQDEPTLRQEIIISKKGQQGVNAVWVNPAENPQVYTLRKNGELYASGENGQGQLGVGFRTGGAKSASLGKAAKVTHSIASVITLSGWADIMLRTMAIKTDGSLWLWGYDIMFDFTGERQPASSSVKVMDGVASGAVASEHSLIIKKDGSLWVWGYNKYVQLGTGGYEDSREPLKIMEGVIAVAASNRHSLALMEDGSLWAWGDNEYGQLGTGDTEGRAEPVKVMESVTSMTASSACTVAVKTDGSVWMWGTATAYLSIANMEDIVMEPTRILE